jgi:pimeloyl-ACP methyl ester carboxylesterase
MHRGHVTDRGIWAARGGSGEPLLVLLHGMGANACVWERLLPLIEGSWRGQPPGPVTLVGHSFGGAVAALVASGWFAPRVQGVAAFGVKIEWTADEIEKAREPARRPAPVFATRDEATARYLRISGLAGLAPPSSATAAAGVTGTEGRFQVAMDPRAYGAVGPSVGGLLRSAAAPLRLAAGDRDPMVTLEQMRRIDPAARVFEGVGHNAHWEAPERVWDFIAGGAR